MLWAGGGMLQDLRDFPSQGWSSCGVFRTWQGTPPLSAHFLRVFDLPGSARDAQKTEGLVHILKQGSAEGLWLSPPKNECPWWEGGVLFCPPQVI